MSAYLKLSDVLFLIQQWHVPECYDGFNRPLTEFDFLSYKEDCKDNLISISNCLKKELKNYIFCESNPHYLFNNEHVIALVNLLILCGEHSSLEFWSTNVTMEITADIINCLLKLSNITSLTEVLTANNHAIFKNALLVLRPKLLSTTWKCNPAAVSSYYWLLMQVKEPHLNDHLKDVLPTALIITDDFEVSNRIKGLHCINHIASNVSKTDLELYAYNEVILEGLRPILYNNDPNILEPLLNCYVTLTRNMDVFHRNNLNRSKYDDIVDAILNNLNLEESHKCKILYLKCLRDMVLIFRLRTLRHSGKLYDMAARELNGETTEYIKRLVLEVFDSTVQTCWPRINHAKQCQPVILAILKLINNFSFSKDYSEPPYAELLVQIRTSLQLIKNLSSTHHLEQVINNVRSSELLEEKFKTLVEYVWT